MSNYVDVTYYQDTYKGTIPSDEIEKRLKKASMHIDTLTYNRIVGRGFDNLTEFQQNIIKEVICKLADFEYENEDLIQSILSSYSINGVSVNFGSNWNIEVQNGIAIKKEDYSLLGQTGLTCRNLRC